jgi:hypothetical protein
MVFDIWGLCAAMDSKGGSAERSACRPGAILSSVLAHQHQRKLRGASVKKTKAVDSLARFQETFEIFANQQAAELEAVRAILQSFLVTILASHREGAALFADLRDDTLKRLAGEITRAGADQDAARKAEFVHLRATHILDEMTPAFGLPPTGSTERKN